MKQFKDFGIKTDLNRYVGPKIRMDKILNREITVWDYRVEESKFQKQGNHSQCLWMQIAIGEEKHVVFTGSRTLIELIQQVPKTDFPFKTTVVREDDRFEFT